ncbi:MAG: transcriptional repressor LexA [Clostridiales bacterium]|nr:transcriptional repressor LexA [Clostridiales bacterium]
MPRITEKDYEIMDFIFEQLEMKGFPPTVREICDAVGLTSTATVHARIKKLENAGYIVKDASKNRSMRLVNYTPRSAQSLTNTNDEYDSRYLEVPVYGKVTAGIPITAVQDNTETFPLPMSFAKNKDLFMLKVQGESMINAAILDGDYIIVRHQPTADNGDIVVALLNGEEATVKTFYKEKGHFRLQPENDTMEPIIVNEVSIIGKVVGVFRQL